MRRRSVLVKQVVKILQSSSIHTVLLLLIVPLSFLARQNPIDSIQSLNIPDSSKLELLANLGEQKMYLRIGYWDSIRVKAHRLGLIKYEEVALHSIAYVYNNFGNIPKAIEVYYEALAIQEKINDKEGIAYSFANLAEIIASQGDPKKAIELAEKSLIIREEIKDERGISASYNILGNIYFGKQEFVKSLEYQKKALAIREKIGFQYGIALSLNNIGALFSKLNRNKEALDCYTRSMEIKKKIGDNEGISQSYLNIGSIYEKENDLMKAEEYAKKAFDLSTQLGYPVQIEGAAQLLYIIYKQQKRIALAMPMCELYYKMHDSLNNLETRRTSLKRQLQYDYEKKEIELKAVSEAEKTKIELKAFEAKKRQNLYMVLICSIALAISCIAIIVFRSLRITRRQKSIIEEQKKKVDEHQKEIIDSIRYARRIQNSLLPTDKYIDRILTKNNKSDSNS